MAAVCDGDLAQVQRTVIEQGSSVHFQRCSDVLQPSSPLRLALFSMCNPDVYTDASQLETYVAIIQLLLKFGADASTAVEMARERFGSAPHSTPEGPVMKLLAYESICAMP
jgi:hypothetical protein